MIPLVFRAALALVLLAWPVLPALAADDTVRRIDYAFRQAALVQNMTMRTCFTIAGVAPDQSEQIAMDGLDAYETVLIGLRDGQEWLDLEPESKPQVRSELDALADQWTGYKPVLQQLIAGDLHAVVIAQMLRQNGPLTEASTRMAKIMLQSHADGALTRSEAATLGLAAEYRILSQRAISELCAVTMGIGGQNAVISLRRSLADIDAASVRLQEGGDGIDPAPNVRIQRNFRTAALFWKKMKPAMDTAANGEPPDPAELEKLLKFNKSVLKQLDQALQAYLLDYTRPSGG